MCSYLRTEVDATVLGELAGVFQDGLTKAYALWPLHMELLPYPRKTTDAVLFHTLTSAFYA